MVTQLLATKHHMTQVWTTDGVRLPVTVLRSSAVVLGKATQEGRILLGDQQKKLKNVNKPQRSILEKNGLTTGFRAVKEVMLVDSAAETPATGTLVHFADVFAVGDLIKVTGTSKGAGFTGVVKRHGFKGGPRTHGQHDRERAPGSIGSGTTPGRVYKNKRMAGRHGGTQVTIEGLQVVAIDAANNELWIKGLIPGSINGSVLVTKTAAGKFVGLQQKEVKSTDVAPTHEIAQE